MLGRRNYLFAGSDAGGERAANLYSLIGTALLNAMDPYLCLRHVLERVAEHPITHRHAAALEVCTGSARRAAASLSVATARKTPFNAVKADAPLYQSRIELRDLEPAIWRQILLPASVKLPKLRSGSGNLDRGIGDGSALCGDDNAADERSREHETTPP